MDFILAGGLDHFSGRPKVELWTSYFLGLDHFSGRQEVEPWTSYFLGLDHVHGRLLFFGFGPFQW